MFFLKNANIGGFVVGNFIFISPLGQCLTALIAKMAFNQKIQYYNRLHKIFYRLLLGGWKAFELSSNTSMNVNYAKVSVLPTFTQFASTIFTQKNKY